MILILLFTPVSCSPDRDNSGFITAGVVGGLLILFVIFKTILVYIFIRKRNTICNKRSLQFIKIIKQSLSVAAENAGTARISFQKMTESKIVFHNCCI